MAWTCGEMQLCLGLARFTSCGARLHRGARSGHPTFGDSTTRQITGHGQERSMPSTSVIASIRPGQVHSAYNVPCWDKLALSRGFTCMPDAGGRGGNGLIMQACTLPVQVNIRDKLQNIPPLCMAASILPDPQAHLAPHGNTPTAAHQCQWRPPTPRACQPPRRRRWPGSEWERCRCSPPPHHMLTPGPEHCWPSGQHGEPPPEVVKYWSSPEAHAKVSALRISE